MGSVLVSIKLEPRECPVCGVYYALSPRFVEERRDNGGSWFCPNGHNLHFTEPRVTNLERQLEWARSARDDEIRRHEQTQHRLRATKAAHTRTKNRIKNGVCPCCRRTFVNLQRHMTNQHPEYDPAEAES